MKRLPKTFQGAEVVRGLGMHHKKYDRLVDEKAADEFDATRDMWLVVNDSALRSDRAFDGPKAFFSKTDAVKYARACGNGNMDQRVLFVPAGKQVLVVATENEL